MTDLTIWLGNDPGGELVQPPFGAPWRRRPSWVAVVFDRPDVATHAPRPLDAFLGCLGTLLRHDAEIAAWHDRWANR